MTDKSRVLVIGLDGATFDLIRPWAAQGKLPTFQRLLSEGVSGDLESTIPPVTSPAWPTFMTGMNPGHHSVFDYIRERQGQFDLVNGANIDGMTIWEILSARGRRVGVMNVPVTYPPRPVNGFIITGLLSPRGAEFTYPSSFIRPYESELGPYRIVPGVQYKDGNEDAFIADVDDLIEQRARYALRLMRDHQWDFLMVHFLALDLLQHALWRHMDASHPGHDPQQAARYGDSILHGYQKIDQAVGRLLAQVGDDTTVALMSDHGFGPLHGMVNLNVLLLRAGLLHLKRDPLTRLKYVLFRLGMTPSAVYGWLARLGLQNITVKVSKRARNRVMDRFLSFSDVDWSRTMAYSIGHVGQVYINLKGRQPWGIVRPEEYDSVRQRVIEVLNSLQNPVTGKPLVDRVLTREQVCAGPYCEQGPDLHLVMDGYRYIACPLFATNGRIITRQIRGDSGCHRQNGVFLARGPALQQGMRIQGAHIVDLAPTLLHLMGEAVPDGMDGRVLHEIFRPAFDETHAVRYEVATVAGSREEERELSSEEALEIEERLRGLGYLG
ncbi:MAG: alkaline phosphatase family protein [Chloroflexota bacterium]|nr:alkaline phosphatase family protein [Chloroflexota bacterium]